jgi:hypothetical protein
LGAAIAVPESSAAVSIVAAETATFVLKFMLSLSLENARIPRRLSWPALVATCAFLPAVHILLHTVVLVLW